MPMAGKGMLVTSMDIDESDEQEFNRWYDREHLAERVTIDGFLEARRYVRPCGRAEILLSLLHGDIRRTRRPRIPTGSCQSDRVVARQYFAFPEYGPGDRADIDQPRTGARSVAGCRPHSTEA